MSDALFSILLRQLDIKDPELLEALKEVKMERVNILAEQKQWEFYLSHHERLQPAIYQMIQVRAREVFQDIAEVNLWWSFEQDIESPQAVEAYWPAIYSAIGHEKPYILATMKQARIQIEQGEIKIGLPSEQQLKTVQDKFHHLFLLRLKQAQLQDAKLHFYVDEALRDEERDAFNERTQLEDEANLEEARKAHENNKKLREESQGTLNKHALIGPDIPPKAATPLIELTEPSFKEVIEGFVFSKEIKALRNGGQLLILKMTDYTSSITLKVMSGRGIQAEAFEHYNEDDWLRVEGDVIPDNYTSELYMRPRSMRSFKKAVRQDPAPEGDKRVELHAHSQMSTLDATNSVSALIERAAHWGHEAFAITDHANVQAFPEAHKKAKEVGIKMLYGMEAYLVADGVPIAYQPTDADLKTATYVVFDVETTGLSSIYDKIIEIAGVKMREGEIIDRYESFINPHQPLSHFTTELTGITNAMVEGAPDEGPAMQGFWDFIEGSILVAHNASFDMGFINKAFERLGLGEAPNGVIDTLELSRLVNPTIRSHGLARLCKLYGIELTQHHRAIYDAEATAYLLMKLLDDARSTYQMELHRDLNKQIGQGEAYKQARPTHATLLVKNQAGLKDLFKLVSEANISYFFRTPRVPKSLLEKYRENFLVGTACSEGEVFTAMMQKGYDEAKEAMKAYDFIEIMPKSLYQPLIASGTLSSEADLEEIIKNLVKLGDELQVPVVATGNVHYLDPHDHIYREVLLRTIKANQNADLYFPEAHFRTTSEMLEAFEFLGKEKAYEVVVTNSQRIARQIEEVEVTKSDLYTPNIEGADEEVTQMTYKTAHELYGDTLPQIVEDRIKKELNSIITNGFSVIYLISQKLVSKSLKDGYLVGSRGSVGSSLVAGLIGITEVNPLAPHYYCPTCHYSEFFTQGEYGSGYDLPEKQCPHCGHELKREGQDIPFETFLGFYGDKVPDIDLNFSGDYQARAHAYTKDLFGEDYVYRAGTIGTVAERTAMGYVLGYMESTGELIPQAEKERLADGIQGVKRNTGQHPGGIIVIPDYMDVYDFTPIQYPADDMDAEWKTTHFDFHSIDENILKLDILGHDDPTMIRLLEDLTGVDPSQINVSDEGIMKIFQGTEILNVSPAEIFSEVGTYGIPEFGTSFVRSIVEETRPTTFSELLQISGLSHGTDVWLGNAQELIRQGIVPLAEVIGCRDDIMTTLMQYGLEDQMAFQIMESVRKGRGIPEDWQEEMKKHEVPQWYIDSCLKIKYMFPKAHAAAYVLMALRVAYFKVYYPIHYYAAYFTVRAKEHDVVAMSQGLDSVKHRIREIEGKGFDATNKEKDLHTELLIVNEMLERGYSFQMVNIEKSLARDFVIEDKTLIPPFNTIPMLGDAVADQIVQAREEAPFLSKEDLQKRGRVSATVIAYMTEHQVISHLPDSDQLSLF